MTGIWNALSAFHKKLIMMGIDTDQKRERREYENTRIEIGTIGTGVLAGVLAIAGAAKVFVEKALYQHLTPEMLSACVLPRELPVLDEKQTHQYEPPENFTGSLNGDILGKRRNFIDEHGRRIQGKFFLDAENENRLCIQVDQCVLWSAVKLPLPKFVRDGLGLPEDPTRLVSGVESREGEIAFLLPGNSTCSIPPSVILQIKKELQEKGYPSAIEIDLPYSLDGDLAKLVDRKSGTFPVTFHVRVMESPDLLVVALD